MPGVSRPRLDAAIGIALGAILATGGLYLAAANYVGAWKGADQQCATTAASNEANSTVSYDVRSTSDWLPYWSCTVSYQDGTVKHRTIHLWWP